MGRASFSRRPSRGLVQRTPILRVQQVCATNGTCLFQGTLRPLHSGMDLPLNKSQESGTAISFQLAKCFEQLKKKKALFIFTAYPTVLDFLQMVHNQVVPSKLLTFDPHWSNTVRSVLCNAVLLNHVVILFHRITLTLIFSCFLLF